MNRLLLASLMLAGLVPLALSSAHAAADGGAAKPAPAAAPAPATNGIDWEHMTVPQKKKFMKLTVLPEAQKIFFAYDPKAFKRVTCSTCHGDRVDDGTFKMPNPKLPRLPKPTARADFLELQKKKPDAVKFMGTVVKPTIARLINQPEWSPENTKGFGCYHCHAKEGE